MKIHGGKRVFRYFILLTATVIAAGCARQRANRPTPPPAAAPAAAVAATPQPTPLDQGKITEFTLEHGGRTRRYLVHEPLNAKTSTPLAVVLSLHGGSGNADAQVAISGLNLVADRRGFLVVYPEGTGPKLKGTTVGSWNAGGCCPPANEQQVDDVGFIAAVLDDVTKNFTVDQRRIYVSGISNGAQMAYRLACDLSDRIAAIAPIAAQGVMPDCTPSRAVSVLHFHGTADPCALYDGGTCGSCFTKFMQETGISNTPRTWSCESVPSFMAKWRERNDCNDLPQVTTQQGGATCVTSQKCRGDSEVTLCAMAGMGHTYPGQQYQLPACATDQAGSVCQLYLQTVGPVSNDLDANEKMWAFFQRHALPPGA